MGGYGSGRRSMHSVRPTVESYRSLDIGKLQKQGALQSGSVASMSWSDNRTGKTVASFGARTSSGKVVFSYRYARRGDDWQDVEEPVAITWTSCNYGGRRPWFICPGCSRRVAILYMGGRNFLCRHCHGLAYASQRETWSDRSMRRARKIRQRFGGGVSLLDPFPPKPKWIRWNTYWRLRHEAETASLNSWLEMDRRIDLLGRK